jgi:hypothetical protein
MFESSAFKPNDKLNWGSKIRDILCKYGFNHVWLSQNAVNEDIFMYLYGSPTLHIHNLQYFLHMCQKVIAKSLY